MGWGCSVFPWQPAAATALNVLGLDYEATQHTREMVAHSAREWLWGFQDPLVNTLQAVASSMNMQIKTQEWISLQFNDSVDMWNHTTAQWTGKDNHMKCGKLSQGE